MKLIQASKTDREIWDHYVEKHPQAEFSHSFRFRNLVESTFKLKTSYYYVISEEKITGICPLVSIKSFMHFYKEFLICLPMVTSAGVLSDNAETTAFMQAQLEEISREKKCYVQIRSKKGNKLVGPATYSGYESYALSLAESREDYFQSLSSRNRNKIRKARKSGVQVVFGKQEFLNIFFMLHQKRFRQFGTPCYPYQFFEEILKLFPQSFIAVAFHEKTPVSAMLNIGYKETMNYYQGCSDKSFYKCYPNNLLFYEVIEHARSNGYTKFDFGRSPVGVGTGSFKAQWKSSAYPLYYQYIGKNSERLTEYSIQNVSQSSVFKLFHHIWSKYLPDFMIQRLSAYLLKRLPLA